MIKYYSQKLVSTWENPTFQSIWICSTAPRFEYFPEYKDYLEQHKKAMSMINGNIYDIEENFFNIYQIIIFIFAGIGIFKNAKSLDLKKVILPIIFMGGFLFHILWETKAEYVIQYYFILLPFTAYGIDYTIRKINIYLKSKKDTLK